MLWLVDHSHLARRLPRIVHQVMRVLKIPVVNPLLALIVRRAMLRCGDAPDFSKGWVSCPGLAPENERVAETMPLEWFSRLPIGVQEQIDACLESELFQVGAGMRRGSGRHPGPDEIVAMLYGNLDSLADFSQMPSRTIPHPHSLGRSWSGSPAEACWVIEARPEKDAWIEMDPLAQWDPDVPRVCLRLGAGLWFHPPARRLSSLEKCPSLMGALDAMMGTVGWDQWVFPLAEALEHAIASRLCPEKSFSSWDSLPRASRWSALPDWTWQYANRIYGEGFGGLIAAIACRQLERFPMVVSGDGKD